MTDTKTDISINFPGIMGQRVRDPEQAVVIENVSGFKAQMFLQKHGKYMQSTLIGRGHPVWCIAQKRVPAFVSCAAKHGLVARWAAEWDHRNTEMGI